eukprot:1013962-Amphidinium_carterae.1
MPASNRTTCGQRMLIFVPSWLRTTKGSRLYAIVPLQCGILDSLEQKWGARNESPDGSVSCVT